MTDWWSNDPIASAPTPPAALAPSANWWEQDATVMPAPKAAPPVDPIKAQVRKEIEAQKAAGIGQGMGAARTFVQGATLGTADEILAAAMMIPNMIKRGVGFGDGYAYAKAKEDALLEDDRASSGLTGAAAEMVGGAGLGAGLYRAGATLAPAISSRLGTGLLGTAAGAAADGVAYGALSGAAEGEGWNRLTDAAKGAAVGGVVGGSLPIAAAGVGALAAPVVSNISARVNPGAYAERQIGKAAADMRLSGDEVANRLSQAAADGQTEFRLMDALGNAGRRKAAVVAKNPGEGREVLTEFLDDRQLNQGYRLSNTLAEGLGAPETAQAASARLSAARRAQDDTAFSAVRADADPVNVTPAIARINETLRPGELGRLHEGTGISYDSVEGALSRARALLTDGRAQVTDFSVVQRARGDVADAVEKAVRSGENNKARLLRQVRNELDQGLTNASPSFREAMANSRAAAQEVEAVEAGRAASQRGRVEDKLTSFAAMRPAEQASFRIGYADPLIAKAQGAAEGVNKARPLTSLAARSELPAFAAPGRGDQMMRRIGRENEMFATRAKATGGSSTSENLSDNAANGIDVGIIGKLLSGEFFGAAKHALNRAGAGLTGNTEAVRENMARLLLRGNPDEVRTLLNQLAQARVGRSDAGALLTRAVVGGTTPLIGTATRPNQQRGR